jgi:glycyl-tRNA synthetase beta chain
VRFSPHEDAGGTGGNGTVKNDFLLEVGCENLPSGYLTGALVQLEKLVGDDLASERVPFDALKVLGTPNRLVVRVSGIAGKQAATDERIIGPPARIGLSPEGRYTKAAEGFAKSQGVPVDRLSTVDTERGAYLAVVRRIRGRSTGAVLRERIPAWLGSVRFPKTMRWEGSGVSFARPLRWILSLLGDRVLRFAFGPLVSGRETRLSIFREESVRVGDVAEYFELMRANGVILDPSRRRRAIESAARTKAARAGGRLVEDEELVGTVTNLLESPVAMVGFFGDSFLALPREVVVTALKSHQRYFSIEDEHGQLRPGFIAFADGARRNKRGILKGYERVLHARLADAEFYYREDTARPLEEMAHKLETIVWLEGMGTLAQKADRLGTLAPWLLLRLDGGEEVSAELLARAALLAKADLASEMVKDGKEFTLLQGYMGREYARTSGEDGEVAEAIFEHYLPRFAGDRLPETGTGTLLSLSDKLDTVVGCFIAGFAPSGSQDPYALRRHALGILRIAIENRVPVPLPPAIGESLSLYEAEGLVARGRTGALSADIFGFFSQRLNTMLRGKGYDYDLVNAILATPWEVPHRAADMVGELQRMRRSDTLNDLVRAMKRVANIIPRGMKETLTHDSRDQGLELLAAFAERRETRLAFRRELFDQEAESALYDHLAASSARMLDLERSGEPRMALVLLQSLVPPINRYFDDVLVICEDELLKRNRIAFLASTYRLIALYCDFSSIAGE